MTVNRRVERRTPIEGERGAGVLVVGKGRWPVLLLDESMCGLGLVGVRIQGLTVGADVRFESPVRRVDGRIGQLRHIEERGEDVVRIGLEWTD